MNKQHLGDSVYVEIEHYRGLPVIKLTTENRYGPSNTICLELFVYDAFRNYVEESELLHESTTRLGPKLENEHKPTST